MSGAVAVALTSVIVTGVVALGSVVANVWNGYAQRRHDAGLAFQGRVWKPKRRILLMCIHTGLDVARAIDSGDGGRKASAVAHLREVVWYEAEVTTYGSKDTRAAFARLVELAESSGINDFAASELDIARHMKEQAIDEQNFDEAARQRDRESKTLAAIVEAMTIDEAELKTAALRLVETARTDLRDPHA